MLPSSALFTVDSLPLGPCVSSEENEVLCHILSLHSSEKMRIHSDSRLSCLDLKYWTKSEV